MLKIRDKSMLIPVMIITLLAIFFFVQPVYAEGEQPVEETVAIETTPAIEDTGTATDTEINTTVIETETPTAETAVTISRDSVETVLEGDPYYKVGATTYNFTSVQSAVNSMQTNGAPSDHKLYIESGIYDEDVDIDGSLTGVSGLNGLIGEGGNPDDVEIDGHIYISNMTAGFLLKNLSVYNDYYTDDAAIWTWDNRGVMKLEDVNARAVEEDSSGIIIEHTGTVILNRVNADQNAYMGAGIYNIGPVTILNSTFDNNLQKVNDGYGGVDEPYNSSLYIDIYGPGAVTVNGVSANWNTGGGVEIYSTLSTSTVKNSDFSENNSGSGLMLMTNTAILENIYANGNGYDGIEAYINTSFTGTRLFAMANGISGIYVEACYGWTVDEPYCHNTGAGTVTIKGSATQTNATYGIFVYSKGLTTLYDVFSQGNGGGGISLMNADGLAPAAVVLTKVTVFDNGDTGIDIYTKGAVTGKNVIANNNSGTGLYVFDNGTGAVTFTIDPAFPLVFNEASGNLSDGLYINSKGAITLISFDTSSNGDYGSYIDNSSAASASPVTYKVLDANNSQTGAWDNGWDTGVGGIYIASRGAVALAGVSANSNQGFGAIIYNVPGSGTGAAAVSISNGNFSDNCYHTREDNWRCYWSGTADQNGLYVDSLGTITLLDVSTEGNYGYGAYINNWRNGATAGVSINTSTGGTNYFQYNALDGIYVTSKGAIVVTNMWACNNGTYGAELYNDATGVTAGITINAGAGQGNSFTNNQGGDGLSLISHGAITITNVNANWNSGSGIYIDNSVGTGAVTIKQVGTWNFEEGYSGGNTFKLNENDGLYIKTRGATTIAFWHIEKNTSDGIEVIANAGPGAVTINGVVSDYGENIIGNGDDGIDVLAKGNITLNYISSQWNDHDGAYLRNYDGTGTVTINFGYFNGNNFATGYGDYGGLYVDTHGAFVWKNGSANGNRYNGAVIQNYDPLLAAKPVSITNVYADNNGGTGLSIFSKGVVLLTNVEAANNSANYYTLYDGDLWFDNLTDDQTWYFEGPSSGDATIHVTSDFIDPIITVYDMNWNQLYYVEGSSGDAVLTVSVTSGEEYIIRLGSKQWAGMPYTIAFNEGTTVTEPEMYYSVPANGIYIDNSYGVNAAVSILNPGSHPWTSNNSDSDVEIVSSGLVTITNMDMGHSGWNGVNIDNTASTAKAGIVLSGDNIYYNSATGVYLLSKGPITIKDCGSTNNRSETEAGGFYIDNRNSFSPSVVVMTNVYTNGNSDLGITIRSSGTVTMSNVYAEGNDDTGIDILTNLAVTFTHVVSNGNGNLGALVVSNNGAFTILSASQYSNFNDNSNGGLYVETVGKVTISKTRGSNNGIWNDSGEPLNEARGFSLQVTNPLGTSAIVLANIYNNENTAEGLFIDTTGAVAINKIQANNNRYDGIYIGQYDAPNSLFPIVVNYFEISNNGSDGLYILGKGNIVASNFSAWGNGGMGLYLSNSMGSGTVSILKSAGGNTSNMSGGNGSAGVVIVSTAAVSVTGLEVSNNSEHGLYVNNSGSSTSAAVTLNGIISRWNNYDGVAIDSHGVVTINNSWFIENGWVGIENHSLSNMFINNSAAIKNSNMGIYADLGTSGNLTLSNSFWFGNWMSDPYGSHENLVFPGGGIVTIL